MFNDIWQKDDGKLANASMLQLFAQDNDLAVDDAKLGERILSMSYILKFIDDYNLHECVHGLFTPSAVQGILLDTYREAISSEKKTPLIGRAVKPEAVGPASKQTGDNSKGAYDDLYKAMLSNSNKEASAIRKFKEAVLYAKDNMLQLFAQDNDLAVDDAKLGERILSMSYILKFIDDYNLHECVHGLFTPSAVQGILLDTYREAISSEKKTPMDDFVGKAVKSEAVGSAGKRPVDNSKGTYDDLYKVLLHNSNKEASAIGKVKKAVLDAKDKTRKALQNKIDCLNYQPKEKDGDSHMNKDMQTILKPIISVMVESCPTDDTRALKFKEAGVFNRELIPGYRFAVILNDGLTNFNYAVITESGSTAVTLNLRREASSASIIDVIKRVNDPDLVHLIDQVYQASLNYDTDFIDEFDKAIEACVAAYHTEDNLRDDEEEPITLDSIKSTAKEAAKSAKSYADQAMDTAKGIYHDKVPYDKRRDIERGVDKANKLYRKGKTTALSMLYKAAKKTAEKLDKYSDK